MRGRAGVWIVWTKPRTSRTPPVKPRKGYAALTKMGATFVGVSLRRKTVSWSWCLAAAGAFSCSVFPDEATLPSASAGAGVGGGSVLPTGGAAGGDEVEPAPLGGAGAADGGALSAGGAGAGAPPLGMAGIDAGGGGAGGGAPACTAPQQTVIAVTADTWIEAAKPTIGHGNDAMLSVVGGGQERRALLGVTLPAAMADAVLVKATFALHLQANTDVGLAARQLRLYQLEHPVIEARATWNKWDNGAKGNWMALGGDFVTTVAQTQLPAGTTSGTLTFDVTQVVGSTLAPTAIPLSLILIETGAPPPAPAELAFTSREGDASGAPTLILEYCEP